ncbi:hypothetical protein TNCV_409851 [Trichonephila clavipes]|nr:hypothetical protein TNCV_409851 [Trichonephila clavipes]
MWFQILLPNHPLAAMAKYTLDLWLFSVTDPIDAFPEHLSTTVVPVTLPDKPDALEYVARQGQVRAGITTKSPPPNGCLFCFVKTIGIKKTWLDNFTRAGMEAKHANKFRPNDAMWEKTSKDLLRNPDRQLKNNRQEDSLHLQQHIFCKKSLYLWLANSEIRRDSLDSNDACAYVDL